MQAGDPSHAVGKPFQLPAPASQPTRAASRWPYTREEGRSPFPGSSFSAHFAIARGLRGTCVAGYVAFMSSV